MIINARPNQRTTHYIKTTGKKILVDIINIIRINLD